MSRHFLLETELLDVPIDLLNTSEPFQNHIPFDLLPLFHSMRRQAWLETLHGIRPPLSTYWRFSRVRRPGPICSVGLRIFLLCLHSVLGLAYR
ncbi:hypothetical protein BJY01DRAFT_11996 [Aspergillus pseudoustus]|uniref:Uncharacterized protein n=1 Tax=Aspergillus pseudoustus TaxID=1810923 RepID=A0ABR4JMV5_9EURO